MLLKDSQPKKKDLEAISLTHKSNSSRKRKEQTKDRWTLQKRTDLKAQKWTGNKNDPDLVFEIYSSCTVAWDLFTRMLSIANSIILHCSVIYDVHEMLCTSVTSKATHSHSRCVTRTPMILQVMTSSVISPGVYHSHYLHRQSTERRLSLTYLPRKHLGKVVSLRLRSLMRWPCLLMRL